MKLFVAMALASYVAWSHPDDFEQRPNEPSRAVQQQEKQADYARKGHPQSGKPHNQEPASVRTKDSPAKSSRKPKPGEAAIRTQK